MNTTLTDMVNGLNRMDDTNPFSPVAFTLAVKLLDLFNRLRWADAVAVDLDRMRAMAKCSSRQTALRARDELISRGVLTVVAKGKKGTPSSYRLNEICAFGLYGVPNPVPNPVPIYRIDKTISSPSPPSQGHDDDDDLFRIQQEHNQVLDAACKAGFPATDATFTRLIDLYGAHGLDKLIAAIDCCVEHSAVNLAYLRAVLQDKPKPEEDSGDWMDALRRRGIGG